LPVRTALGYNFLDNNEDVDYAMVLWCRNPHVDVSCPWFVVRRVRAEP